MKLTEYIYVCSAGETFDSVALALFDKEKYAAELMNANPALCTIPVFSGGEVLDIPAIDLPKDGGEQYMPAKPPWKE